MINLVELHETPFGLGFLVVVFCFYFLLVRNCDAVSERVSWGRDITIKFNGLWVEEWIKMVTTEFGRFCLIGCDVVSVSTVVRISCGKITR